MDIHVYFHGSGDEIPPWAAGLIGQMNLMLKNQEKIMATLDEVLADVTAETTKIDSLSVLFAGLEQQLKDALAGTTLSPATQAKVDAVFAAAETNKGKIDAAIAANTAG